MKDISSNDLQNNIPLVSRKDFERKIIVGGREIKKGEVTIIAGPCTVESKTQIFEIAKAVKEAGATMMRGGVFKPLTFPYGDPLGKADADDPAGKSHDRKDILSKEELYKNAERRLAYFKEAGDKYGLPIVSEVLYADSVPMMEKYVDMFQVGYRHMYNMDLVEALSRSKKPILIKRHYGESIRSLLGIAEHFEARGKHDFVFCERGVATAHTHNVESRAVIDLQAVLAMKENAPSVPVFVDPSHSTFKRSYVAAVAKAAIAIGADGILIDVHPDPENAWVDPLQSLNYEAFGKMIEDIKGIAKVLGKELAK